jgi:hypothetical protein
LSCYSRLIFSTEQHSKKEISCSFLVGQKRNSSIKDWSDKEFVLGAVKKYGGSLKKASKELQNNKEIVLEAVKEYGDLLKYVRTSK